MARDVDEQPIAWREAGEGTPILLLHGLGGSRTSWEAQLGPLANVHRVIAWDQPGYGASASPGHCLTFPFLARAASDLVDRLDIGAVHVVGISFGGMIAQHLAARHPDRVHSLTLLATSPAFGLDGTRPDEWRARRLAPLDAGEAPADFAERVLRGLAGPHITADAFEGQRAAMVRISSAGLRAAVNCITTHDARPFLGTISAPTLCVVGELDEETPVAYAEHLAAHIPAARLVIVPGVGHLLNAEAPDVVNELVAAHVDRASPA